MVVSAKTNITVPSRITRRNKTISEELKHLMQAFEKLYIGKQNDMVQRENFYNFNQYNLNAEKFIDKVQELADNCDFPPEAKDQ
jgi:hypothetical protein